MADEKSLKREVTGSKTPKWLSTLTSAVGTATGLVFVVVFGLAVMLWAVLLIVATIAVLGVRLILDLTNGTPTDNVSSATDMGQAEPLTTGLALSPESGKKQ